MTVESKAKTRRIVLLVAIALLWSGHVTAQPSPPAPSQIRKIGVVTVIPSRIHVYRFGMFDTACDWLDITNLHLEKAAFDGAARALSHRYEAIRTTVDRGAVIRTSNTEVMGAFKSFPSIGEQVRDLARPESQVDAYLLIWSSHSANKCQLMPGALGYGFGLTKNLNNPPGLHVFADASVIDARTLKVLSSRDLRPAYVRLDNFEWKDTLAEMTSAQRQLINALFPKMVAEAVFATSKALLMAP